MQASALGDFLTLDETIAHLVEHRRQHPEHAGWHVEVRDHLLIAPPQHLTHDDREQVVILLGWPSR